MKIPDSHIILNSNELLNKYCEPLFKNTEIICFEYDRYYEDGHGFTLNSVSPIFTREYIAQEVYPTYKELADYFDFSKYAYLDDDFNKGNIIFEDLNKWQGNVDLPKNFDVDERFYIFEKHPKHFNIYGFSCGIHNKKPLSFYMENIVILEKFIIYINSAAKNLLADCEKNRIRLDLNFSNTPYQTIFDDKKIVLNHFDTLISEGSPKNKVKVRLTKAEERCLSLLIKGLTSKEIAREIDISFRTVEQHVASIRNKFNCKYTKQIFSLLHDFDFKLD